MKRSRSLVWFVAAIWALAGCSSEPEQDQSDAGRSDAALVDTGRRDAEQPDVDSGPAIFPEYTEDREVCRDRNRLRNVYFGDTHVHTSYSFDAYGFGVRLTPADAYRFAKGEPVNIGPVGSERTVQLDRPLDFAIVTDHAEYFGETDLCRDPESEVYDSSDCVDIRDGKLTFLGATLATQNPRRPYRFCGGDDQPCRERAGDVWRRIQQIDEANYDRSADCSFTNFVGYEYSNTLSGNNHHRVIIFRNKDVIDAPITTFDEIHPSGLYRRLEEQCVDASSNCDVLAIPHNANQGAGSMFPASPASVGYVDHPIQAARIRARMEPLFEVYQHKGDSACRNGLSGVLGGPDEFCNFEKLNPPDYETCDGEPGVGGIAGLGCVSKYDFWRNILSLGLRETADLGFNPYRMGAVASTDTHNGIPGMVREKDWPGHIGNGDAAAQNRLSPPEGGGLISDRVKTSPGGLAGVWAVENSRDAIFEAMQRRETFGTSGPRIRVRLFAGWDYPDTMCETPDFAQIGYRDGVAMGGNLDPADDPEKPPKLAVMAFADTGSTNSPATPLERIQIIKGTVGPQGQPAYTAYDVAGSSEHTATVDTSTCEASGDGHDSLCAVWTDPNFDPDQPAFYYARVLENPTCRWSTRACNRLEADQRPPNCDNPEVPKTIQERAWTSPVWYQPDLNP